MNTDEELREIAEELRIRSNCVGFKDCTGCQALSTKLFGDRFVLCQLDNQDAGYWGAVADLIDPPTTPYICEKCGGEWPSDIMFKRCPYCGEEIKR